MADHAASLWRKAFLSENLSIIDENADKKSVEMPP